MPRDMPDPHCFRQQIDIVRHEQKQCMAQLKTLSTTHELTVNQANTLVSDLKSLLMDMQGQQQLLEQRTVFTQQDLLQSHHILADGLSQERQYAQLLAEKIPPPESPMKSEVPISSEYLAGGRGRNVGESPKYRAINTHHPPLNSVDYTDKKPNDWRHTAWQPAPQEPQRHGWKEKAWAFHEKGDPPVPTVMPNQPVAIPMMPLTVSDPPAFNANKYGAFRKELLWWKDPHYNLPDAQLLMHFAIKTQEDLLKPQLTQYLESTRDNPSGRRFVSVLSILDTEFKKSSHETALAKITTWPNFARRPAEGIRAYWIRFERLPDAMTRAGITFPQEVSFYNVLSGMKLAQPQLGMLMAIVESRQIGWSMSSLKHLSLELLDTNFLEPHENILKVEGNPAEDEVEQEGEELSQTEDTYAAEVIDVFKELDEDVCELRKVKKMSGRNLPGLRGNSIKNARTSYDFNNRSENFPRNTGALTTANTDVSTSDAARFRCWRCGSQGPTWGK